MIFVGETEILSGRPADTPRVFYGGVENLTKTHSHPKCLEGG